METNQSTKSETSTKGPACSKSGVRVGGMCLNWNVIGGLAALGVVIWVVAPGLIGAALPLLALAACPLSMMLMMRGMSGSQQSRSRPSSDAEADRRSVEDADSRPRLETLRSEHARLTAELEALERRAGDGGQRGGSANGSHAATSQHADEPAREPS